jgi:hypothetical protein
MSHPPATSRRSFLIASAAALGLPGNGAAAALRHAARRSRFRASLSVSPFTEAVLSHVALTDGRGTARTVADVQRLFMRHGASEVYARIATRRHTGGTGEAGFLRGLERARLARSLGLPFNPELGLFAVYGDAATYQQPPDFSGYPAIRLPSPWLSLTLEEMERALRQYGELVARQILGTGVRVEVWDIGNEVEFGVAGVAVRALGGGAYRAPGRVDPAIGTMSAGELIGMTVAARIAWLRRHLWPYVGRLLAATAAGIRSVDRNARFSTHISGIFEPTAAVPLAFWEAMEHAGFHADVLGTSYYPTAGGLAGPGNRFAWLKDTAAQLARRFGKPVFIAEGDYPSATITGPYPYNSPVPGYPQSNTGQARFIYDLVRWGVKSGHLAGFRPWAPDFCTKGGWAPMSFFTVSGRTGHAKPGLSAMAGALRA